ncbi:MAG: hypothetical protein HRU19_20865 [Pseudobacteriovorax sp.]|nr:hypothetical protein [Pseudobacteriovorax sp.]
MDMTLPCAVRRLFLFVLGFSIQLLPLEARSCEGDGVHTASGNKLLDLELKPSHQPIVSCDNAIHKQETNHTVMVSRISEFRLQGVHGEEEVWPLENGIQVDILRGHSVESIFGTVTDTDWDRLQQKFEIQEHGRVMVSVDLQDRIQRDYSYSRRDSLLEIAFGETDAESARAPYPASLKWNGVPVPCEAGFFMLDR